MVGVLCRVRWLLYPVLAVGVVGATVAPAVASRLWLLVVWGLWVGLTGFVGGVVARWAAT